MKIFTDILSGTYLLQRVFEILEYIVMYTSYLAVSSLFICVLNTHNLSLNSGEELLSDSYPIKDIDDVVYEVEAKVFVYVQILKLNNMHR